MAKERNWTQEDEAFLDDNYGYKSLDWLCEQLGRTPYAIKNKAVRLGLGRWYNRLEIVTVNELANALNTQYQTVILWSEKYGLPKRKKRFIKDYFSFIDIDLFWKWAENHSSMIEWNKVEKNVLGAEPEWVDEMRTSKIRSTDLSTKKKKWSKDEIEKLRWMLNQYKFTYPEICQELGRSHGAVKRKIHDLGIKQRPVYLPNTKKYSTEEVNEILRLYEKGYSFKQISTRLGRSEAGVRGKIERMGYTFTNKLMKASEEDDSKV